MTVTLTHPLMTPEPATPDEIVDAFLHGVATRRRDAVSLRRLLESHLWPYRRLLLLVVVLQSVQTFATLTLPPLNADLINHGVLEGDNAYIWRTGRDHARLLVRADRVRDHRRFATAPGWRWPSGATCAATSSTR